VILALYGFISAYKAKNKANKKLNENNINRFAAELEYINDVDRKNDLREILTQLRKKNDEISEKAREDMNIFYAKLRENQYKKAWHCLLLEQKKEQIEKYYKEKIEDETKRNNELNKIFGMWDDGKLKQKMITYDQRVGKI
jgi:hypothetical protein